MLKLSLRQFLSCDNAVLKVYLGLGIKITWIGLGKEDLP